MAARLPLLLCAFLALAACNPIASAPAAPTRTTAAQTSAPTAPPAPRPTASSPPSTPTSQPTASPARAAQQAFFAGRDRELRAATQANRDIQDLGGLPADANALWLAPGGQAVAFVAGGRLAAQVVTTGERQPLTPPGLAIDTDGRGVFLPDPDAPGDAGVVTHTALLGGLSWSPAGDALLFSLDASDEPVNAPQPTLYLATLDGAPPRALGPGLAPSWSPAGDRIAYLGPPFLGSPPFGGGSGGQPMLANADGSDPRVAGDEQVVFGSWAPLVWSADGARLGVGTQLLDAATGAVVARAPDNAPVMIDGVQQVAPDGKSFLYWRNQRIADDSAAGFHELDELLLVFEDGGARPLIRRPPNECPCLPLGGELRGVWSPSGGRIALADPELGLRLYTGDGTPIGRLPLPGDARLAGDAHWSADEARLLVSLAIDARTEAWLLDARGQLPRQLGEGAALGWGP